MRRGGWCACACAHRYAQLVDTVRELSDADAERVDEFIRYGMWLNVAAAIGVEDLSAGCEWVRGEAAL